MKFKKVPNVYMFSRYVREDGAFSITSCDVLIDNRYRPMFVVRNRDDEIVSYFVKLRDAKAVYSSVVEG